MVSGRRLMIYWGVVLWSVVLVNDLTWRDKLSHYNLMLNVALAQCCNYSRWKLNVCTAAYQLAVERLRDMENILGNFQINQENWRPLGGQKLKNEKTYAIELCKKESSNWVFYFLWCDQSREFWSLGFWTGNWNGKPHSSSPFQEQW